MPKDAVVENYIFMLQNNLHTIINYLYPRIYPLHDFETDESNHYVGCGDSLGEVVLPRTIPATLASLDEEGVYLIDNGRILYVYVRQGVTTETLRDVSKQS